MSSKARVIAFYLPQFHPIPENDAWWGKGFTEWTNVAKAKPLFWGHYQPRIPADLGFYDLRLPVIREQQARMAREAGIEGFCYWHYWFNGKQLLETPFEEVLKSGQPDFPFCLGWANHTWGTKTWRAVSSFARETVLMEQTYSEEDWDNHFYHILPAMKDKRYITVDGKPLFVIFDPLGIPDTRRFIERWQELAKENGLVGIHFTGIIQNFSFQKSGMKMDAINKPASYYQEVLNRGFDAVNSRGFRRAEVKICGLLYRVFRNVIKVILNISFLLPLDKYNMKRINRHLYVKEDAWENVYPSIMPNYDKSPRSGRFAAIYTNTTPDVFKKQVKQCLDLIKNKSAEHKIIFLVSWNEWGEGNYMEPDLKYGHAYLNALKEIIT